MVIDASRMPLCSDSVPLDHHHGHILVAVLLSVMLLLQGYLGIGFPAQPGKMAPADAIMGSVDDATGAVQVRTLPHAHSTHSFLGS